MAKGESTSIYVGKHSFLCSDHHGRNSYSVVQTRYSYCTWASFEILLSSFNRVRPRKRTRIFSSQDVLGLSLVWINSTCRQKHLSSMFAMTQGCVSYSLDLGGLAYIDVFTNFPGPELNGHQVRRSQNSDL